MTGMMLHTVLVSKGNPVKDSKGYREAVEYVKAIHREFKPELYDQLEEIRQEIVRNGEQFRKKLNENPPY